jgi:hypothetical protein
MKTLHKHILLVSAFVSIGAGGLLGQEKSGKVTIERDNIVIHPGAKISKEDEKALNDILKKYDKSLYKVETYKGGKVAKQQGQLSDVAIDKQVESELNAAKAQGVSDKTVQFVWRQFNPPPLARGMTTHVEQVPPPPPPVRPAAQGKQLVDELKPILQKYQKK